MGAPVGLGPSGVRQDFGAVAYETLSRLFGARSGRSPSRPSRHSRAAERDAATHLRRSGEPVRRRLHRLAADEFLQGELVEGTFACAEGRFTTSVAESRKKVTVGLRPEDCRVTGPSEGKIAARVYAVELIGDHTLITCQFGGATVTVKADKSAHYDMDEPIGITFQDSAVFLFDAETGARIGGRAGRQAAA
nr:TOBE domain-containing protein [Mesorhizobium sp.]